METSCRCCLWSFTKLNFLSRKQGYKTLARAIHAYFYISFTDAQHSGDLTVGHFTVFFQHNHIPEGFGQAVHRSTHGVHRFLLQNIAIRCAGLPRRLVVYPLHCPALTPAALGQVERQILAHAQDPELCLLGIRESGTVLIQPDECIVSDLLGGLAVSHDSKNHAVQEGEGCCVYVVEKRLLISPVIHNTWTRGKVTYYSGFVSTISRALDKIKVTAPVRYNEPLGEYTTFRVGGPADALVTPGSPEEMSAVLAVCHAAGIPVTLLGGGANVVVSDRGIRGVVVRTARLNTIERRDATTLYVESGADISAASARAAEEGVAGLDFIYAMPGSTGGAIWMNARCYDGEIAGILEDVWWVPRTGGGVECYHARHEDFAYKVSPFQDGQRIIVAATFRLQPGIPADLWATMRHHEADRRAKGHFAAPCAGSVFKNNRDFGAPSGQIIDELGLRGFQVGGARVSDAHGNIIINTGHATATDIRRLTDHIQKAVHTARGFQLEPEVLFIGEWPA